MMLDPGRIASVQTRTPGRNQITTAAGTAPTITLPAIGRPLSHTHLTSPGQLATDQAASPTGMILSPPFCMSALNFGIKTSAANEFLNDIFGTTVGSCRLEGLVDVSSQEDFDQNLRNPRMISS